MGISISEASVGVFVPNLRNLSALLDKASAFADSRGIDAAALLQARLAPDMYSFLRQVCEANRHATIASALLAGRPQPSVDESETDIAGLKTRLATAIDDLQSVPHAAIEEGAMREAVFTFRNGNTRRFADGSALLLTFSLPQFFFHVTTAYDILRHAGVPLAKSDYLGVPR
ncbi:conserved hypothetical protein [Bradyrhizobium sp. ORS 278]|uniref:DUF1993 domain-containing protein n=1 Tax=Bradyrhizobium sp. (strain ORS 278) TaxID=114615 RepID=UPI0001508682|nr:DUF1993 domain-containing protein [Bradyrhizobium sp. ORS 278]CAL77577.1 conserved hypothetical protein [Bradyrhizobium sp. ORS 278]